LNLLGRNAETCAQTDCGLASSPDICREGGSREKADRFLASSQCHQLLYDTAHMVCLSALSLFQVDSNSIGGAEPYR